MGGLILVVAIAMSELFRVRSLGPLSVVWIGRLSRETRTPPLAQDKAQRGKAKLVVKGRSTAFEELETGPSDQGARLFPTRFKPRYEAIGGIGGIGGVMS